MNRFNFCYGGGGLLLSFQRTLPFHPICEDQLVVTIGRSVPHFANVCMKGQFGRLTMAHITSGLSCHRSLGNALL